MPWIHKIYIVTNGQQPSGTVMKESGVFLVRHEEFFSDKSALPTFNSNAIEANVAFIDGLSEKFIVFNDDFFVASPLAPEDFFTVDGAPIIRAERHAIPSVASPHDLYAQGILFTDRLLSARLGPGVRNFVTHTPFGFTKDLVRELWSTFPEQLRVTTSHKFRAANDIVFFFICSYFLLWKMTGDCGIDRAKVLPNLKFPTADEYRFVFVGDGKSDWNGALARIISHPPNFFCLNDHIGGQHVVEVQRALAEFYKHFSQSFPTSKTNRTSAN